MKKLLVALTLLILCAGVPMAQTGKTENKPEEMRGLTKVFVDSGTHPKDRERIAKVIESAKLGLTVLDSAEGAEIILNFVGGETQTTVDWYNPVTKFSGPLPVTLGFGRGVVYVVRGDRRRAVLFSTTTGGTTSSRRSWLRTSARSSLRPTGAHRARSEVKRYAADSVFPVSSFLHLEC